MRTRDKLIQARQQVPVSDRDGRDARCIVHDDVGPAQVGETRVTQPQAGADLRAGECRHDARRLVIAAATPAECGRSRCRSPAS
jgi:hypothetical protein